VTRAVDTEAMRLDDSDQIAVLEHDERTAPNRGAQLLS
jgi:hypothetical protein